ncbi:MAG: sensor histidine kinase [Gemmatimonadetes bacterium]|jgi:signal transduction histidine kinase|nr:sensor histidine kinase [Gemmatimonadota bacterium]
MSVGPLRPVLRRALLALLLGIGTAGAQVRLPLGAGSAAQQTDRYVLMLDFGDPNRPAFVPFNAAFLATLRADTTGRTIVFREHHDPRISLEAAFDSTAVAIWGERYARVPIDLIVANGPIELQLAVRFRTRLGREIPIVYRVSASVPTQQMERLTRIPLATGVVDAPLLAPVVADLRRLRPTLRHLLLVGQNENDVAFVREETDSLLSGVTLHPWFAPSIAALRDSVRRLPEDAAVLYVSVFLDADGRVWTPADYLEAFAPFSAQPIFGLYRNLLGRGIVGGPIIDPMSQGEAMARRTLDVLHDRRLAATRVIDTLAGWQPTYAWPELERHGISLRVLPTDAVILDRPIPIWQANPIAFSAVTLLLLLQSLSIGALIANRRLLASSRARLRALTHRLQTTQEEEQARLSRELHDTLGQDLLSQALDLERSAQETATPQQATFATRLRQSVTRLEGIARELNPNALRLIDLRSSLRQLATDLRNRTGIAITISEQGLERSLPPDLTVAVFRIVQEALTNVRRHAQASEAAVLVQRREDTLEVTVRDDGVGFDPARSAGARLGLLGMQERAHALGGRLTVTSAPEDGTTVTLTVPLPTTL